MKRIRLRTLRRLRPTTIASFRTQVEITSGDRIVATLEPVHPLVSRIEKAPAKRARMKRLRAVLERAENLAKGRDVAADDAALEAHGIAVDKTDWSFDAVERLRKTAHGEKKRVR